MQASFVIPTYNRARHLRKCLDALIRQDYIKSEFEIVIIDDGSTDNTAKIIERLQKGSRHPNIRYFKQKNQGQGMARNLGISHAKGKIILLIGDDIICNSDFLKRHMDFHNRYRGKNEAVLGLILWHPDLKITPLMEFLTNGSVVFGRYGGHQFAYDKLLNRKFADYNFFYTSNISLKRSLLEKFPFDMAFSKYGWEDIELGYRLTKEANLKLYYNKNAIGYHLHSISDKDFVDRMRMIGKSAKIIDKRYPELQKVPRFLKKVIFQILSSPLVLMFLKKRSSLYYYALSKKYFLEGLES